MSHNKPKAGSTAAPSTETQVNEARGDGGNGNFTVLRILHREPEHVGTVESSDEDEEEGESVRNTPSEEDY